MFTRLFPSFSFQLINILLVNTSQDFCNKSVHITNACKYSEATVQWSKGIQTVNYEMKHQDSRFRR